MVDVAMSKYATLRAQTTPHTHKIIIEHLHLEDRHISFSGSENTTEDLSSRPIQIVADSTISCLTSVGSTLRFTFTKQDERVSKVSSLYTLYYYLSEESSI